MAGALRLGAWPAAAGQLAGSGEVPEALQELWAERAAIMVYDGTLQPAAAPRRMSAGGEDAARQGTRYDRAAAAAAPPARPGARRSAVLRDFGWCWTGVAGWGRGAPQGIRMKLRR